MFSYTDSVFQTNSGCQTKNVEFQEIPVSSAPSYSHHDDHEPAYNIEYPSQQINMCDMHQHQQQGHRQQWQDHSFFQQPNSYFPSEMIPNQSDTPQSIDQISSFGQYYSISPFSSPIPTHHSPVAVTNQHRNSTIKHTSNNNSNNIIGTPAQHPQGLSISTAQMLPSNSPHSTHATQSSTQNQRPRITTSLWDDEGTVCYQVDVRGICVARRQDNDMINGTKLLNVTGMSRGKRDGILKNEKGRVVVKVGAMHLKGVWVTFARAKALAIQFNIVEHLHPLFVDDPALYFYSNQLTAHNYLIPNHPQQQQHIPDLVTTAPNETNNNNYVSNTMSSYSPLMYSGHNPTSSNPEFQQPYQTPTTPSSNTQYTRELPSAPFVPSMIPVQSRVPLYGYTSSADSSNSLIHMSPY
ncbi:hypothetical protein BD560DRAFT_487567 [Blakeslea trispora]|nr:hypothetical protein BD560DRAFT_487567 [Blakeslea trispora]